MSKHKEQHLVPVSYLKPWCDQSAPEGYKPYVWIFSKDGSDVKRKSPKSVFYEKDFYTIERADGSRDLKLEHGLAGLESEYCSVRDRVLKNQQPWSTDDHVILCAFVAAMKERVKVMAEHETRMFQEMIEFAEKMKRAFQKATAEQRKTMSDLRPSGKGKGSSISLRELKMVAKKPIQYLLAPGISTATPLLSKIDFAVLVTSTHPGFITSDNPCVWTDPESYKRPPFDRGPGLIYDSIEITMPISPKQAILLNRKGYNGYIVVPEKAVDRVNRITRFNAYGYFVVNSNCKKDYWFDPGRKAEDSWDKRWAKTKR